MVRNVCHTRPDVGVGVAVGKDVEVAVVAPLAVDELDVICQMPKLISTMATTNRTSQGQRLRVFGGGCMGIFGGMVGAC